jgi:2-methylcitrate dehydratase PrpD
MPAVTHALADFALATRWSELPGAVRAESVRAFVNWVGCAVGGSTTSTADAAVRGAPGTVGSACVLGRRERLAFPDAAVVDCVSSSAHTFDDTHLKTITHPTGPVAAPLLAYAQANVTRGEDLLAALAVGMEIECRLATAIAAPGAGSHQGWYMTGLAGGVGAAAALARVMGLGHAATVSALGIAATSAGGLRASHGSMAIAYVPAAAGRQGMAAAYLARGGFTCGDIAIDGRNGLLQVVAPGANPEAVTAELGTRFEFLDNAYKPYPCGIVIHPAIDACLEIAARDGPAPEAIERVDLAVHPDAMNLCWRKLPATPLDAQVSLYHWVAAALVHRAAGIAEGEAACVEDARVRALQERIFPAPTAAMASDQAVVSVRLRDGRVLRSEVEHAVGSVARPMTDAQLDAKFRGLAARALGADAVEALLAACRSLPGLADAGAIARLGVPA